MSRLRLRSLLTELLSTLWFIPTLMVFSVFTLHLVTLEVDQRIDDPGLEILYDGGPEGARELLGTIAGSIITVAGVAFSVTIVALSIASSQFGPRLLQTFMRDTGSQVVLGTFIATFMYCLLVLRQVKGGPSDAAPDEFVPAISITLSLALALVSVGMLIYFINHIATIIQGWHVVSRIGGDLLSSTRKLFPGGIGHPPAESHDAEADIPDDFDNRCIEVDADRGGYVMGIDGRKLMDLACEHDVILRIEKRPGHYVIPGTGLMRVWPAKNFRPGLVREARRSFILGPQRTVGQDVEFAVEQLVEIAVRALSPGINTPSLAVTCLNQLATGLAHLAREDMPSPYRYDDSGRLRVIAWPSGFGDIVDAAFNEIRQYGASSVAVSVRLLEIIEALAAEVSNPEERDVLLRQAEMTRKISQERTQAAPDREDIEDAFTRAARALHYYQPASDGQTSRGD